MMLPPEGGLVLKGAMVFADKDFVDRPARVVLDFGKWFFSASAIADDDTISIRGGSAAPDSTELVAVNPRFWDSLLGCRLDTLWEMTNDMGNADSVLVDFLAPDRSHRFVHLYVAASSILMTEFAVARRS